MREGGKEEGREEGRKKRNACSHIVGKIQRQLIIAVFFKNAAINICKIKYIYINIHIHYIHNIYINEYIKYTYIINRIIVKYVKVLYSMGTWNFFFKVLILGLSGSHL